MIKSSVCAMTALFLMSGAAFAQPPNQPGHAPPAPGANTEAVSAVEDAVASLVGQVSAEMTTTTRGFATAAAVSDMYEVEAGRIAADRARSDEVKAFARMMVDAHTKTTAGLKSAISAGKADVTLPTAVDNRRQGMLDNLRGADAGDFDYRYMTQQVAAHREAERLFDGYSKDGDNQAVKDFAAKTVGDIRSHLTQAEALRNRVSQTASNR